MKTELQRSMEADLLTKPNTLSHNQRKANILRAAFGKDLIQPTLVAPAVEPRTGCYRKGWLY